MIRLKSTFLLIAVMLFCSACPGSDNTGELPDSSGPGAEDAIVDTDSADEPDIMKRSLVVSQNFNSDSRSEYIASKIYLENGEARVEEGQDSGAIAFTREISEGRITVRLSDMSKTGAVFAVYFREKSDDESYNVFFSGNEFALYKNTLTGIQGEKRSVETVVEEGVLESGNAVWPMELVIDFTGTAIKVFWSGYKIIDHITDSVESGMCSLLMQKGISLSSVHMYDYSNAKNVKGSISRDGKKIAGSEVLICRLINFDPPKKVYHKTIMGDSNGRFNTFLPPGEVFILESDGSASFGSGSGYGGRIMDPSISDQLQNVSIIVREVSP